MVYIYELKSISYPNRVITKSLLEHKEKYSTDEFEKIISEAKWAIEEYVEEYTDDKYDEMMEYICDEAEDSYLEAIASYLIEYKGFHRHIVRETISAYID